MLRILSRKTREQRPALPADVANALAELARLSDERPSLAELAIHLNACLRAAYAEPVSAKLPAIEWEAAREKLAGGIPLLRGETLDLDRQALEGSWQRIVAAVKPYRPDAAPALAAAAAPLTPDPSPPSTGERGATARMSPLPLYSGGEGRVRGAADSFSVPSLPGAGEEGRVRGAADKLDVMGLASLVLGGAVQGVHERAEALGLDVPLTSTVLWLTLFPVLASIRTGLEPLLRAAPWQQGYCPICGSFPKLGEFRGLEQIRWLRCSLCAAQWELSRLRCFYCGNRDHRQLGYLYVEGEEGKCRAATCDRCGRYVKMVSALTPLSAPQLLVTDLATMHLDLLAADRGFAPPGEG